MEDSSSLKFWGAVRLITGESSIFFSASDNVLLDLVNHPVHLLDDNENLSPSAFIPFCSFQGSPDLLSREFGNFSLPVCNSFEKRLLDGQLCYQIDVNRIINETTAAGLQKGGLSLLVDANTEYDLTRVRMTPEEDVFDDFTEEFFEAEESENIMIHIETISKTIYNFIDFFDLLLQFHSFSCSSIH